MVMNKFHWYFQNLEGHILTLWNKNKIMILTKTDFFCFLNIIFVFLVFFSVGVPKDFKPISLCIAQWLKEEINKVNITIPTDYF